MQPKQGKRHTPNVVSQIECWLQNTVVREPYTPRGVETESPITEIHCISGIIRELRGVGQLQYVRSSRNELLKMGDSEKVRISVLLAKKIRQHGVETYPHECCGALLGRDGSPSVKLAASREILEVLPLINRRDDSPRNRFSVAPRDVIEADRAAQARGLEVVGWYHSHPDQPARSSKYDREHAWPWYSYVIVSVRRGVVQEITSWRLHEDRTGYTQEVIEIHDETNV